MKKYKEITTKVKVLNEHYCDICGADMKKRDYFDCSEVTIEAKIGSVFPEGDSRTKYSIDVCANCFEDKIVPLFEQEFGVKFQEEDCE